MSEIQESGSRPLLVQFADQTHVLHSRTIVGRKDKGADIQIDDEYVSNMHAVFWPYGGEWLVEDLGSTNGTYIVPGYKRSYEPMILRKGDRVRIGHTLITVVPA